MRAHVCPTCRCLTPSRLERLLSLGRSKTPVYRISEEVGLAPHIVTRTLDEAGIAYQKGRGRPSIEEIIGPDGEAKARRAWFAYRSVSAVADVIGYANVSTRRYLARLGLVVVKKRSEVVV